MTATNPTLERNKAIVRRFKECQGTKDQDATMREIMSPDTSASAAGSSTSPTMQRSGLARAGSFPA